MDLQLSALFQKVLEYSRDEALRTGWRNICPDHIMLGILRHGDNSAVTTLEAAGLSCDALKQSLDDAVFVSDQVPWDELENINLCESAVSLLQHASLEAARCSSAFVEPLHFLLACSRISGSYTHDWLEEHAVSLRALVEASGCPWDSYGLNAGAAQKDAAAPNPEILAAAIEKRIRDGYVTDNPHVS